MPVHDGEVAADGSQPRRCACIARRGAALESICLELGGSIAHHHGVGVFRNEWLRQELGVGLELLQILKDGMDPQNLLNPGKVGLRGAPGAMTIRAGGDNR